MSTVLERPSRFTEAARMEMWRELWRHLLKVPSGVVLDRELPDEEPHRQDAEAES